MDQWKILGKNPCCVLNIPDFSLITPFISLNGVPLQKDFILQLYCNWNSRLLCLLFLFQNGICCFVSEEAFFFTETREELPNFEQRYVSAFETRTTRWNKEKDPEAQKS